MTVVNGHQFTSRYAEDYSQTSWMSIVDFFNVYQMLLIVKSHSKLPITLQLSRFCLLIVMNGFTHFIGQWKA